MVGGPDLSVFPRLPSSHKFTPSMENKLPFVSCARDTVLGAGDALYIKQRAIPALVEPGSRILKKAVIKDKTRIRKTWHNRWLPSLGIQIESDAENRHGNGLGMAHSTGQMGRDCPTGQVRSH